MYGHAGVSGRGGVRDQFFEERIFGPLEMHDTYFYLPQEKAGRLAAVYAHEEGKLKRYTHEMTETATSHMSADYPIEGGKTYFLGGAGVVSTAADYVRFCQMMLNGGELDDVRILGRKSVQLMTVDYVEDEDVSFGLRFGIRESPGESGDLLGSEGSYEWGGYWGTGFWIDPEEELIGIVLTQVQPSQYNVRRFQPLVYQALAGDP